MSGRINPDPRALPPGWFVQYDPNYNRWFYVNTRADPPTSSWTHPNDDLWAHQTSNQYGTQYGASEAFPPIDLLQDSTWPQNQSPIENIFTQHQAPWGPKPVGASRSFTGTGGLFPHLKDHINANASLFLDSVEQNELQKHFWNPAANIAFGDTTGDEDCTGDTSSTFYVEGQYDFSQLYKRLLKPFENEIHVPIDTLLSNNTIELETRLRPPVISAAPIAPKPNGEELAPWQSFLRDRNTIRTFDWTQYMVLRSDKVIGSGGYGDVFEGEWQNLPISESNPPRIVIKRFRITSTEQKEANRALKGLFREIAVWHTLKHPNVVPFVGVFQMTGKAPCLVSERMSNGSVKSFISRNVSTCLLNVIRGVVLGLKYLHDSKIIHGDMKADNVLMNGRGEPCLCDFGLSRVIRDNFQFNTSATHASGTLRWMSPELLDATQPTVTVESDIYAYGMTCYEIMTGAQPFRNLVDARVIMAVLTKQARPTRDAKCITNDVWDVMESCWAQDPNDRISISRILEALESHHCKNKADTSSCIHRDE